MTPLRKLTMYNAPIYSGTQTVTLEGDDGDHEFVVDWQCRANVVYRPAQLYGPPENCYPDESECEIFDCEIAGVEPATTDAETLKLLLANLDMEDVEEHVWEQFMDPPEAA